MRENPPDALSGRPLVPRQMPLSCLGPGGLRTAALCDQVKITSQCAH
jgi:hypothetical protein